MLAVDQNIIKYFNKHNANFAISLDIANKIGNFLVNTKNQNESLDKFIVNCLSLYFEKTGRNISVRIKQYVSH